MSVPVQPHGGDPTVHNVQYPTVFSVQCLTVLNALKGKDNVKSVIMDTFWMTQDNAVSNDANSF